LRPIDAHVHIGRWQLPDFAGREQTLAEANQVYLRWNWSGAVVFPTDEGRSEELLRAAGAMQGPVAWRVGFWADFGAPANLGIFETRVADFALLKLHPSCLRTPATDARFSPYLEIAAARGMPTVIHCGRWQEVAGYERALEVALRHPNMPLILAHMGGDSPALVRGAVDAVKGRGLENVFFGTESIREPWLLEYAINHVGANRLIFGSDFNLNHPEMFRRLIDVLDISDEQRELIFRRNINRLLCPEQRFFKE